MSPIIRLTEYIDKVPRFIRHLPAGKILERPDPGKWSKQEILGHLCDSALHNLSRFSHAAQTEGDFTFSAYQQNEMIKSNHYQEQHLAELILLWQVLNQQLLRVWTHLSVQQWDLSVRQGEATPMTLQGLAEDYIRHLEHHLEQIFSGLEVFTSVAKDQVTYQKAQQKLDEQTEQRFVTMIRRGSMSVELYHPFDQDLQQPHRQDELYVVLSGKGDFFRGGKRTACQAGDVLFVPAGMIHRFENFSQDFKVWVIFYGPDGGERAYPVYERTQIVAGRQVKLSTDGYQLNFDLIIDFLQQSYWGKGRPKELLLRSFSHSLNFGLYLENEQIGFARVITDYATVAYLADVFIVDAYQGQGMGTVLMQLLTAHPALQNLSKILLHTKDAHGLYEQFGFKQNARPDLYMEKYQQIDF